MKNSNARHILIFLFLMFFCRIYGQEMTSRIKTDEVITSYFSKYFNNKILAFSINDLYYLVIIENDLKYEEYYISLDTLSKSFQRPRLIDIKQNDSLLKEAFKLSNYHTDFIDIKSDYYKEGVKNLMGSSTYFVLYDEKRIRYGESKLNVIIEPNPIYKEVYLYLVKTIIAQ